MTPYEFKKVLSERTDNLKRLRREILNAYGKELKNRAVEVLRKKLGAQ